ncbi:helix-turn-helix domain-containing protein [Streptomyces sp. NPDC005506]|uniref:helix-turn-helix domain-containing protein n=1 Tax=unclassified Streptomyces TaxID=2593676 RepID=UPI0036A8A95B
MELAQEVGERLRRLRQDGGLSLSELARRSGVGKGTLSELETGQRNPTLETLYALATALEALLSMVVSPAPVQGAAVRAVLTDRVQDAAAVSHPHSERRGAARSAAHVPGTEEHLLVFSGTARVGPASTPFEVGPGGHARWVADVPHQYEAVGRGCWWCATRWNEMPTPHRPAPGHDHRRSAAGSTAAAGGRQYPV